ncbi:MAG: hypothetical protein ACJ8H8_15090 [Geminicoccaceae bacterium]
MGERRAQHLHVAGGIDTDPARWQQRDHTVELIAILGQCSRGEPGAAEALRAWQGGRISAVLRRMLADPALANRTFDRLIADLAGTAGVDHGGDARKAEDWLFSRLRLYARDGGQATAAPPKLHAVEPAPREAEPPPTLAATVVAPKAVSIAPREVDHSPEIVNPRLRRPTAPVAAGPIVKVETQRPRRRRWPRFVLGLLACLAAAGAGFGLTVAAVAWLTAESPQVTVQGPAPAPAPALPPAAQTTPPPAPPPPMPSAREVLGDPLAAREPEIEPSPVNRAPTAPVETGLRIVVHYTAADRDSSEVAGRLAQQLQRAGLGTSEARAVPFRIGSTSIRYFHAEDRGRADRLVAAIKPFLSWNGRAAPSTPIDFGDFRPLPQPGTVEIWLPGR